MSHRPKKQSSNIVITIKYGGLKATQFFSKYTPQAYRQLLEDLRELGFPFPKKSNIVFLSHGTLEFFWPIALHEKTPFVTNLVSRVNIPDPGPFKDEQITMRRRLSIFSLTVREDQNYDPFSQPQNSGPQVSQTLPKHVAPPPNKPPLEQTKNAVRYHPYSRPQLPVASNSEGHQVSGAKPVSRTLRSAETFLDEVGSTLGMAEQVDAETVFYLPVPRLPPSFSKPSEPLSASQRSVPVKQENSSPKLSGPAPPSPVTRMSSPSAKYRSRNSQSAPNVVPSQKPSTNGARIAVPSAPHHSPTMDPRPCPTSASGSVQSIPTSGPPRPIVLLDRPPPNVPTGPAATKYQHPRKSDTITTSNPHISVPHQSLEPSASHVAIQQRPSQPSSSLSVSPISPTSHLPITPTSYLQQQSTDQLLKWVDEFRKNLASAIERQNRVVDELDQRKVPVVPPKLSLLPSNDEAANKAKLQEMEREVKEGQTRDMLSKSRLEKIMNGVRAKQAEMQNAIATERTKRVEIEGALRDERVKRVETEKVLRDEYAKRVEMENALRDERAKRVDMENTLRGERVERVEAENALRDERAKRGEAENVLRDERAKRIEMENVLKDIERERKSPFIVPALLDTFIQISQATTAAINHQASSNMDI